LCTNNGIKENPTPNKLRDFGGKEIDHYGNCKGIQFHLKKHFIYVYFCVIGKR
jgi:hypothetical protein